MEIVFHSHANKTHFHKKGCVRSLILKVRVFGSRKWPIVTPFSLDNALMLLRENLCWSLLELKGLSQAPKRQRLCILGFHMTSQKFKLKSYRFF